MNFKKLFLFLSFLVLVPTQSHPLENHSQMESGGVLHSYVTPFVSKLCDKYPRLSKGVAIFGCCAFVGLIFAGLWYGAKCSAAKSLKKEQKKWGKKPYDEVVQFTHSFLAKVETQFARELEIVKNIQHGSNVEECKKMLSAAIQEHQQQLWAYYMEYNAHLEAVLALTYKLSNRLKKEEHDTELVINLEELCLLLEALQQEIKWSLYRDRFKQTFWEIFKKESNKYLMGYDPYEYEHYSYVRDEGEMYGKFYNKYLKGFFTEY